MDNGLVLISASIRTNAENGLNPCCSGQWSSTQLTSRVLVYFNNVLILVVVDNGLVHDLCYLQSS